MTCDVDDITLDDHDETLDDHDEPVDFRARPPRCFFGWAGRGGRSDGFDSRACDDV